jgi:hypothetical protein
VFHQGEWTDSGIWHNEEEATAGHGMFCYRYLPHRLLPGAEHLLAAPPIEGPHDPPLPG